MPIALRHLLSFRGLSWIAVLAGVALVLCFTPLFERLAYPFALVMAPLASLAAAHLGTRLVARTRRDDEALMLATRSPPLALLVLAARSAIIAPMLLVLPLLLITLNALRVRNCDPLAGVQFFVLMPLASAMIAALSGMLWGLLVPRPALASTAALLTVIGSALWGLYRFYDSPPIFAYDPFVGYFSGTVYDEAVAVHAPLLFHRLQSVLWLSGALLAAGHCFDVADVRLAWRRWRWHRRLTPAAAICLAGAATLFALRAPLGFAIDAEHIQRELGGVRHSTHFDIHHPAAMSPLAVDLLVQDHEFRYAQLSALLGAPQRRIRSYIFASAEQKRALIGAANTYIAKPWRAEVYLQQMPFPHAVLKHELAHVFAAAFGDPLFGVSIATRRIPLLGLPYPAFNVGLIEGLAVAVDNRPAGEATLHQRAAALSRIGLAPPIAELFGARFLVHASARAYTLAGSFCRYLLGRHGAAALRRLYRSGGDFQTVYGRSLETLAGQWQRWLATVELPPRQLQLARESFRRPSIFRRVCPHAVARLHARADEARRSGDYPRALALVERICTFDAGDPGQLRRLLEAQVDAGDVDAARAVGERLLQHPALSRPLERAVLERLGDLRWSAGDTGAAGALYARAARRPAEAGARRVLFLKRWALAQPEPGRRVVRDYILDDPDDPRGPARDVYLAHRLRALTPRVGIGSYLASKQLANRGHCRQAIDAMQAALALGLPNADFQVEARRVLGRCQYLQDALQDAAETFTRLRASAALPAGIGIAADDWLARIHWRQTGRIPPAPVKVGSP